MRKMSVEDNWMKFVLVGNSGVGKSCLLIRFVQGHFPDITRATVAVDFRTKKIDVDGRSVKLQLWDTAGQEQYQFIVPAYYRGASGALICFDITRHDSFSNILRWVKDLRDFASKDLRAMLVGMKSDLSENRNVTVEEAEAFARTHDLVYIETSALDGTNVDKTFQTLSRIVLGQDSTPSYAERHLRVTDTQSKPRATRKKSFC